jgi:hypothetical protein
MATVMGERNGASSVKSRSSKRLVVRFSLLSWELTRLVSTSLSVLILEQASQSLTMWCKTIFSFFLCKKCTYWKDWEGGGVVYPSAILLACLVTDITELIPIKPINLLRFASAQYKYYCACRSKHVPPTWFIVQEINHDTQCEYIKIYNLTEILSTLLVLCTGTVHKM